MTKDATETTEIISALHRRDVDFSKTVLRERRSALEKRRRRVVPEIVAIMKLDRSCPGVFDKDDEAGRVRDKVVTRQIIDMSLRVGVVCVEIHSSLCHYPPSHFCLM